MSSRTPSRRGASKSPAKKKSTRQSKIPGWLWLVTGFAAGFFVAFLIKLTPSPVDVPVQTASEEQEKTEKKDPDPVFDFYTVLPEAEVVLPESSPEPELPKTAAKPEAQIPEPSRQPAVVPTTSTRYLLQAGSFRSEKDADRLRAQLLLAGQQPRVTKVTVGAGESWHRVQLGPFEDQESLDKARSVLADFKIEGLLLRMK